LLAPVLLRDCPDIESTVRIEPRAFNIHRNDETIAVKDFCYSEQSIFSIFSFAFLEGSPPTALKNPHSIVLSRNAANTWFGKGPALGKTLVCNGETCQVTGVVADRPGNSDLPISALVYKDWSSKTSWINSDFDIYTFVLFRNTPNVQAFNDKLPKLTRRYIQPELDQQNLKGYHFDFMAEKLADMHFSKGKLEDTPKGDRQFLTIFSWLAIFILLIALLNYINLSTAKAVERAKEVAVRKVVGARPGRLVRQFIGESAFLIAIACVISFGIVLALLPLFNRLLDIRIRFDSWGNVVFPVLLFPLTTILAGGYPAFVLSRFSPLRALKGYTEGAGKGVGLRKTLIVIQFVIALAMLAGTVVIYRQMQFISHKDLGADHSGIACFPIPPDPAALAASPAFIQALRQDAGVQGISIGSGLPVEGVQLASTVLWAGGKQRTMMFNYFYVDPQLLPLLHIGLAAGRNFSDSLKIDKQESFIVNEALVRTMGWKTGVGQPIAFEGSGIKGKIIGVVKDFYFKSLHNVIEPMVFVYRDQSPVTTVMVKTSPKELSRFRQLWHNYLPAFPFSYYFMDEQFDKQYATDRITMSLFNIFTFLAVIICLIGLYGLISLLVLRRTKELGVRKVLGASVGHLVTLFTNDLLVLIGIAAALAFPLAALGAGRWLASYAYHTSLSAWFFAGPVILIVMLALSVAAYRVVRAALANPVNALRSE
jgi:putative ABC transport system permease protein